MELGLHFFLDHDKKEEAVRHTEKVQERPALDWDILKDVNATWLKNNLAYYYASQHEQSPSGRADLKDKARQLAEEVKAKYSKGSPLYGESDWLETHAFVLARFASTPEEIDKAEELILGYLEDPDLKSERTDLEKSLGHLRSKRANR